MEVVVVLVEVVVVAAKEDTALGVSQSPPDGEGAPRRHYQIPLP